MIPPLALQDPSKPLVVSSVLSSKKTSSNSSGFILNDHSLASNFEFKFPSINFASNTGPNTTTVTNQTNGANGNNKQQPATELDIPIIKKRSSTDNEIESSTLSLPTNEVLSLMYIFYTVCMGIGVILLPHYSVTIALLFSPFFIVTIGIHALVNFSIPSLGLGILLVTLHPLVIMLAMQYVLVGYLTLFIVFCLSKLMHQKIKVLFLGVIFMLIVCVLIGIVVYQVYPRSVHGIHASFLCSCVLVCTTLLFQPKYKYRIVTLMYA
jgi:hypothetical protein